MQPLKGPCIWWLRTDRQNHALAQTSFSGTPNGKAEYQGLFQILRPCCHCSGMLRIFKECQWIEWLSMVSKSMPPNNFLKTLTGRGNQSVVNSHSQAPDGKAEYQALFQILLPCCHCSGMLRTFKECQWIEWLSMVSRSMPPNNFLKTLNRKKGMSMMFPCHQTMAWRP